MRDTTYSDNPPPGIPQVLIARHPFALGLFELDSSFPKLCNPIEFDDEVQVLNEDVDVVVTAANTNVHLRFNREGTDGQYQPQKRGFCRICAARIDSLEDRASTSIAAHMADPIKSSEQFSSYFLGARAALILMKHRELTPYVERHTPKDEGL